MVKKIVTIAAAGALLLSVAAPVLGCFGFGCFRRDKSGGIVDVNIDNRDADVDVTATAFADTGGNTQNVSGGSGEPSGGDRSIRTGDAFASALATADVNNNDTKIVAPCRCTKKIKVEIDNDNADVDVDATADADTGDNHQNAPCGCDDGKPCGPCGFGGFGGWYGGGGGGDRCIRTGDATAWADAYAWVNFNVTRILR